MPDILVEVAGAWLGDRQADFLRVVHRAVAQALQTPHDEPVARLLEHPAHFFLTPKQAGDRFTRIEIALFAGRSLEAKRKLFLTIVEAVRSFEVSPDDVKIVLLEVATEDVGLRGGKAACDIKLGYSLHV